MSFRVSCRKPSWIFLSYTFNMESWVFFFSFFLFFTLFILIFDMCHCFCNQWSLYQGKNCSGKKNIAKPTHTMNLSAIINVFSFLFWGGKHMHMDLQPRHNILYNTENNLVKEHKYATWFRRKILSWKTYYPVSWCLHTCVIATCCKLTLGFTLPSYRRPTKETTYNTFQIKLILAINNFNYYF